MRMRNSSNYYSGYHHYHEPSVKQVYEYDNGDVLGSGPTNNTTNHVYCQFMDRTGSFFDTPLPGGTVLHTGPYFHSNQLANFAGGSLTGVANIQKTGAITCDTLTVQNVGNDNSQSSLNVNTDLMLPTINGIPTRMYMFDSYAWLGHGSFEVKTSDGSTANIGDGGPTLSSYNGGSLSWSWSKASYDGIPQAALKWSDQGIDASGGIKLDGSPFTSDDRLKDDEQSLEAAGINSAEILNRLSPLIYTKKKRSDLSVMGPEVGLIAHDTWNALRNHPEL